MDLIWKTLFVYTLTMFIMKIMGKREIGQLSLFDFIVLLLIADASVLAIDKQDKFFYFLIPVFVLVIIQKLLAFIVLKSKKARDVLDGNENIIIYENKLVIKEMKKQSYNIDDLLTQIRLKNVSSLKDIKYLFLETNGEISIFLNEERDLKIPASPTRSRSTNANSSASTSYGLDNAKPSLSVFPLITSGKINYEYLKLLNISETFIKAEINKKGYLEKDVYYACLNDDGSLYIMETIKLK